MLLYRIQNKQTKKFFAGVRWYDGKITWTTTGAFFRRPDSMKKHLTYLIGEYLARKRDGFPRATKYNGSLHYKYRERWDKGNYHYRQKKPRLYKGQLKHYRVVINDVLVRGEKFVNAKNFMDKEKQNERERIKA